MTTYSVTWYVNEQQEGDLEAEPYQGAYHGLTHSDALRLVNSIVTERWSCFYQDENMDSFIYKLIDPAGHMVGVLKMSPKFQQPLDIGPSL